MDHNKLLDYIKEVLENMPTGWLDTTTHRLDIYDEKLAKTQFLEQFENLYNDNNTNSNALDELPTAYDYIRLGHPLSCILEWGIANLINLNSKNIYNLLYNMIEALHSYINYILYNILKGGSNTKLFIIHYHI